MSTFVPEPVPVDIDDVLKTYLDRQFQAIAISSSKSGLSSGGIVASCKYNGYTIMYQNGVSDVTEVGNGGYRVTFDTQMPEFDQHYAPVVTPFVSPNGRSVVCALTGFSATKLEFTLTEFDGAGGSYPAINSGFSMVIVDMITN